MNDYHINIFYSEEDGGYIADIPDLESCSAFGETPEQALAELVQAREAWLEAARESGKPIPIPRSWPVIYQTSLSP
jgi:predicted RNase H-like HicB family nuclease